MPRAISFPFRFDSSGRVATETVPASILRQDVLALLGTVPGERVMLPDYGVSLLPYVFENLSPADQHDIQYRVNAGFQTYAPDASLLNLDMHVGPDNGVELGTAEIDLQYIRRESLGGNPLDSVSFTVGRPQ